LIRFAYQLDKFINKNIFESQNPCEGTSLKCEFWKIITWWYEGTMKMLIVSSYHSLGSMRWSVSQKNTFCFCRISLLFGQIFQFFSHSTLFLKYYEHLKKNCQIGLAVLKWCDYQLTAFLFLDIYIKTGLNGLGHELVCIYNGHFSQRTKRYVFQSIQPVYNGPSLLHTWTVIFLPGTCITNNNLSFNSNIIASIRTY